MALPCRGLLMVESAAAASAAASGAVSAVSPSAGVSSLYRKKDSAKEATTEITRPMAAHRMFLELSGSTNMAMPARPGPMATNALTFIRPTNRPPMKLEATTDIITFLCCRVTPYRAGSVMPNRPEMPAEIAVARRFSSLVFRATPRQAPPSEMLCAREAGMYSISKPGSEIEATA